MPGTRIFFSFLPKYLDYYMYKPIPIEEKLQKNENSVSSGPKVLLFCLLSVPWTGNELAGIDVENCETSQLTPTLIPSRIMLFCISQRWITLEIMFDSNVYLSFLPAVFRSRLEQKTSVTECLVCCVCVLFSIAKSNDV